MHLFLPFFGCIILLSSCARYQYATIESPDVSKNGQHQFVVENDTLRLVYDFHGRNAPVQLAIQNKLDVPVYIDWKKSALIVNDKAITYAPSEMAINGSMESVGASSGGRYRNYNASVGSLNAVATLPESMDFVPPHSYINKRPLSVTNFAMRLPDSLTRKVPMYNVNGDPVNARYASFTAANSPLRFRSYLTLAVGEAGAAQTVLQHTFYVAELVSTGARPQMLGYESQKRGDKYFVRETTGYGRTMTGFGVIAGTAVVTGAAAALEQK